MALELLNAQLESFNDSQIDEIKNQIESADGLILQNAFEIGVMIKRLTLTCLRLKKERDETKECYEGKAQITKG